jgi:hypothetical protein
MSGVLRSAACFTLILLLGGCESRERANPFDPRNPETHGSPAVLDARAGNHEVILHWDIGAIAGVETADLYRREIPSGPEMRLTPGGIDPASGIFADATARNGVGYEYRLEIGLSTGASRSSAWDAATPGRAIPWVAHADGGGLALLTPDGRDLVRRVDTGRWFLDLAADTSSSTFWAADYLGGSLSRYDADGNRLARFPLDGARAVAVSPDGESVWDASFRDGRIEWRTASGVAMWSEITGSHVEDILADADGGVWTAAWFEGGIGEVRFYRDSLMVAKYDDLIRPVALTESDRDRVVVVDRLDLRLRSYTSAGEGPQSGRILVDPGDVCPDGTGGVWVSDPGRGGLVHLNRDLEEVSFVVLPKVLGITLDAVGGRLWAAGEEGVHVLDLNGGILSSLSLAGRPVKVELLYEAEVR